MAYPYFYMHQIPPAGSQVELEEEVARHAIQVLRMQTGERLTLTDGLGHRADSLIVSAHKKKATVQIENLHFQDRIIPHTCIAISPLKNTSRMEWFLEKATELGVAEIIPLICRRTEKQKLRTDRMEGILRSAMLQSQQAWKPVLHEPVDFQQVLAQRRDACRLMAHCMEEENKMRINSAMPYRDILILIGPEGDFTEEEAGSALLAGYQPVTLGPNRLRTETAALTAAVWLTGRQ